jgi:hypothetical protein
MDISIRASPAGSRFPYHVQIKGKQAASHFDHLLNSIMADKHVLSEDEKKTQE